MKIFLACLGLLLAIDCAQIERNCKNFKNGTFTYDVLLNGELVKGRFERQDSLEVDYFLAKKDSSHIRWINACEYIVTKLHPKNRIEKKAIHMKILTTTEDSYTFEYSYVGKSNKKRGTVKKIN